MEPKPDHGAQTYRGSGEEQVKSFGKSTPLSRPGQPAELAPVSVLLASNEVSFVSGATVPVTGGTPMI